MASNVSRFRRWLKALVESFRAEQRMEITVQTDRLLIIHRRQLWRGWCEKCGREVEMVGVRDALAIAGGMQRRLGRDSHGWHVCEGADGQQLICLESVLGSG